MDHLKPFRHAIISGGISLTLMSVSLAQARGRSVGRPPAANIHFVRAFVVDDRLSALRRDPDQVSELLKRLHLGRQVFVIGSKGRPGQPLFYRVAVSRRTRGWIHHGALALPSRPGEDERVWELIETARDSLDRIALCRLLADRFPNSSLVPRALLSMGEEADHAAQFLSRRARKRLTGLSDLQEGGIALRDFYLNDSGLDRYSKLRVKFEFNQASSEFFYDGQAYRELARRFPASQEAGAARGHLGPTPRKVARE